MRDRLIDKTTENDYELEKLCSDSVELIQYARNMIVKHVNMVVRLLRHYLKNYRKSLEKDFQKIR